MANTEWTGGDDACCDGGGGGAGAVSSVFGRTGAVVAALSDYDASQVDNDSLAAGTTVADALSNHTGTLSANTAAIALNTAKVSNKEYSTLAARTPTRRASQRRGNPA